MKPKTYKEDEFIHYISKESGEYLETKSAKKLPKKDAYEIPFSSFEKLELNKKGQNIPFTKNNVINIERYMFKYWTPIIGSDAVFLYLQLWEYCDQDEGVDMCYPKIQDLAEIMGKSKPTINKLLNLLQENNFIFYVYRLNKLNGNKETSPLFKLRQTVPLLSKEQYNQLPKKLQTKHDEYMKKFGSDTKMSYFKHSSDEVEDYLLKYADKVISKKTRAIIDEAIQQQADYTYLMSILSKDVIQTLVEEEEVMDGLEKLGMSKPSRETYFKGVTVVYDSSVSTAHLIYKEQSIKDFTVEMLQESAKDKLREFLKQQYGNVFGIEYYTVTEYIYKVHKQ